MELSHFYHMFQIHEIEYFFYENEGFTRFYDMRLSPLVYIVFIVHIAISIVGD